jgi:amidase
LIALGTLSKRISSIMAVATVTTAAGNTWQEVAADRQKHREETIAAVTPPIEVPAELPLNVMSIAKDVLTAEEIEITESLVEELVPKLAQGKLSATTVTKAFLRRAALAQKLVCL